MPSTRHRGWFGWLGLFALALQLVLWFGHHHDHREAQDGAGSALAASACESGTAEACQSGSHDHDDGDEQCAICWAMAAAAGVVLPALNTFTIAAERIIALVARAACVLVEHCPGRLFQARAPPLGASI